MTMNQKIFMPANLNFIDCANAEMEHSGDIIEDIWLRNTQSLPKEKLKRSFFSSMSQCEKVNFSSASKKNDILMTR